MLVALSSKFPMSCLCPLPVLPLPGSHGCLSAARCPCPCPCPHPCWSVSAEDVTPNCSFETGCPALPQPIKPPVLIVHTECLTIAMKTKKTDPIVPNVTVKRYPGQVVKPPDNAWNKIPAPILEKVCVAITGQAEVDGYNW